MQKYYEKILEIGEGTFVVEADGVQIGEMVLIEKQDSTRVYGSVLSFDQKKVTVQVFGSTKGLSTGDKVVFLKKQNSVLFGPSLLGRILNPLGEPIDGKADIEGIATSVNTPSFNPVRRKVPRDMIRTGIPMIDVFNCLVKSQKIPVFCTAAEKYNELLMRIGNQASADVVVIGLMAVRQDDLHAYVENASKTGSFDRTVMFVHMATDSAVECTLVPDIALSVAEQFAQMGKNVLVLLSDMTAFADALKEIGIGLGLIPSNRGYLGALYSDLALRYEKAVDIENNGSVTLVTATTMPGDDVTHPVPDNTGYITEGQFYLRNGRIEPFGSLSRLKQNVIGGKDSREDHGSIMNTMIRLYADSLKSRELISMGFHPSKWDQKLIKYSDLFEDKIMSLEVDIPLEQALDLGWSILRDCFTKEEVGIKPELTEKYWPKEETQEQYG